MPDILSIRYYPLDGPRLPNDPGLEAPPVGRPYEIVTQRSDGYWVHQNVYPDSIKASKPSGPDAASVAQTFAAAHEALFCRQARAWFVWDGALWRPDRGGTVAQAFDTLAREAIADATRGIAPKIGPSASPPPPSCWPAKTCLRTSGTRSRCGSARRAARSIPRQARCGMRRSATASPAPPPAAFGELPHRPT